MQFLVSSDELIKNLQALRNVINNNNTMPVLDNFLFELNKNSLKITASDMETTMTANIPVESNDTVNFLLPARLIVDTVKALPTQPLTFTVQDNNTIDIVSETGKYSFAYTDADEYPNPVELEESENINIPADILTYAISKTIFAASNDEVRPTMTGILFEFSPEKLNFVATDAHKLVKYERTDISAEKETQFILPKKPLQILKNYIDGDAEEVNLIYNEKNVKFSFDNIEIISRLINGQYPNYNAVIPKENPNVLVVDRQHFLDVTKRISIFANKATHLIRVDITGSELKVSAEDLDFSNKAEERLTCNFQGDDMAIGFNSKFLIEVLSNLDSDEISINMSMPNKAAILHPIDGMEEGEHITMLVMPLMLN